MPRKVKVEIVEAKDITPTSETECDHTRIIQTAKRKGGRVRSNGEKARHKFTNAELALMINSHNAGMSPAVIAPLVNSTPRTVATKICLFKKQFRDIDNLPDFKIHRSDLLASSELTALKAINEKIEQGDAKLGELAKTYSVLHTANRLERNLSTANTQSRTTFVKASDISNYSERNE